MTHYMDLNGYYDRAAFSAGISAGQTIINFFLAKTKASFRSVLE